LIRASMMHFSIISRKIYRAAIHHGCPDQARA
jgi:hypothetical protein